MSSAAGRPPTPQTPAPPAPTSPAATPRPPATVIVCTRHRPELIATCVGAIGEDLTPSDELIVVESGGDAALAPLRRLPPSRRWSHVVSRDRRKTAKINFVTSGPTHEALVLTDDDCVVPTGWIDAMTRALHSAPDIGVAFGPVRGLTGVPGSPTPDIPPGPAPIELWNFAHGASMAVRRSALIACGGFDERFGPGTSIAGGEEADLVLRLKSEKWKCTIAPAPTVTHVAWRDERALQANLRVYDHASGVWLGSSLRREPVGNAKVAILRLRHQAQLWADGERRGDTFGRRSTLAFLSGMAHGIMLTPKRGDR